jgi:hypothetical protein
MDKHLYTHAYTLTHNSTENIITYLKAKKNNKQTKKKNYIIRKQVIIYTYVIYIFIDAYLTTL